MQSKTGKERAYAYVATIPKGKVSTYGRVAKKIHLRSARPIGAWLHANTDTKKVPCHRVVFHDGSLSHAYAMGGMEAQRKRLLAEGVIFKNGKVDLKKCLFS